MKLPGDVRNPVAAVSHGIVSSQLYASAWKSRQEWLRHRRNYDSTLLVQLTFDD